MRQLAAAALAVAAGNLAHADTAAPDSIADVESREANLEPDEPRKGVTLSAAVGAGILLGGDIGVGRGPAFSLRLGHVATRRTVITFEVVGTSGLHKAAMEENTLSDSNVALLAGAQRYASSSLWLRGAGGVTVFVEDAMPSGGGGKPPVGGLGALVGGGVDLARWGYLVLGLETFGMASLSGDGVKLQLAFSLGLSYY